ISNGDINISDPNNVLQSKTMAKSINSLQSKNFSTNINFRRVIDSTGKELTADLDYIYYNAASNETVTNSYFDNSGNTILRPDTLLG
ncbi:hypothetical protein ACO1MO_13805, partial [Staphylococcus aureus]